MTRSAWDTALESYFAEHDSIGTGADARGPGLLHMSKQGRIWAVRQTLDDPAGHRDWVIEGHLDLDATDEVGEPVLNVVAMRRL